MPTADDKIAKHYFHMLTGLNKYDFQCSVSSPSGMNWSPACRQGHQSVATKETEFWTSA